MEKKTWFLKRWTISFVDWLDLKIFGSKTTGETSSLALLFWRNLSWCFIVSCVVYICTIFTHHDTTELILNALMGALGLMTLIGAALFLRQSLGAYPTTTLKVVRSAYVVVMLAIAMSIGVFTAIWATLIVLTVLVLGIILWFCFGNAGKKKIIRLSDGTKLTEKTGICGETIYEDSTGRTYRRNSDGSFSPDF